LSIRWPRLALSAAVLTGALTLVVSLAPSRAADEEPWKAPARAAKKANPIPSDEKSIAAGKVLYGRECLSCHGSLGKGDGPAAKDLEKSPGDLSKPTMWDQTDGAVFWKLTNGKKPMPSFEKNLTDDERWQVVDYIRTLAPKPADKTP